MITTPRPMNTFKCDSYAATPKTEAELNELALTSAAKAVPDAAIENHPAVIRAVADAAVWEARFTRLTTHPGKHLIADLMSAISNELTQARHSYRFACLDDFLNGSLDFNNEAAIASERIALLERRLHAAKTASADLNRRGSELNELREFRDKAKAHLASIRFELKRKAVLVQQPAESL